MGSMRGERRRVLMINSRITPAAARTIVHMGKWPPEIESSWHHAKIIENVHRNLSERNASIHQEPGLAWTFAPLSAISAVRFGRPEPQSADRSRRDRREKFSLL